jgi:hypothetical protein
VNVNGSHNGLCRMTTNGGLCLQWMLDRGAPLLLIFLSQEFSGEHIAVHSAFACLVLGFRIRPCAASASV